MPSTLAVVRTPTRLVAMALFLPLLPTHASDCYSIKDPDQRNACLAESTGKPSYCYSVRDPNDRASLPCHHEARGFPLLWDREPRRAQRLPRRSEGGEFALLQHP